MALNGVAFAGSADITSGQACLEFAEIANLKISNSINLTGSDAISNIPTKAWVDSEIQGAFETVTSLTLDSLTIEGNLTLQGGSISGVATPSITATDSSLVATKGYVDTAQMVRLPVRVAQNPLVDVLDNAIYSASGMTLTSNTSIALILDGVSVTVGDRVLIWGIGLGGTPYSMSYSVPTAPPAGSLSAATAYNGVYLVTFAGSSSSPWVLTRTIDFDQNAQFVTGIQTIASNGSRFGGQMFRLLVNSPFTLGTSSVLMLPQLYNTSLNLQSLQYVPTFYSSVNTTINSGSSYVILLDNGPPTGTWSIALPTASSGQLIFLELANLGSRICKLTGSIVDIYGTPASALQLLSYQTVKLMFGCGYNAWRPLTTGYSLIA